MSLQITNQADYALRAMLYLARLGYGKRAPSNVIAEEMSMSRIFLSRINTQLVNARLITTWRGAHGGVSLTRPPSEISVYDVLTAVDGPIRLVGCIEDPDCCPFSDTCPLHRFWIQTEHVLTNQLKNTSLQDLIEDESKEGAVFLNALRKLPQQSD